MKYRVIHIMIGYIVYQAPLQNSHWPKQKLAFKESRMSTPPYEVATHVPNGILYLEGILNCIFHAKLLNID